MSSPNNLSYLPTVRFSDFTDNWESTEFGKLISEYRKYTVIENEDTLLSCAIEGMFLNSELFSHQRGSSNIGYLKIKKGDLILSAQNLHLGNANVNLRFDHGIISPAYKVYDILGCLPEFLAVWVKKESTKQFFLDATTAGASQCRKNIEWNTLYQQNLPVPAIPEQQRIAVFFLCMDRFIEKKETTLSQLQNLKLSMLSKMFPQGDNAVPEIRFSSYSDSWQTLPLCEIATKVVEKNTAGDYQETFTNSAEYGIISQRDFFDHDVSSAENIRGYYVVREKDFVYNPRISATAPVGPINCNNLNRAGVMSPLYTVFRTHNIDTSFLEFYFKSNCWHSYMYWHGNSGARADRFSITDEVFMEIPIKIPSREEQLQIAAYFSKLYSHIDLLSKEIALLNSVRRTLLEKMFA